MTYTRISVTVFVVFFYELMGIFFFENVILSIFLTIFNEGTYLTFKSIFHKALNLFWLWNHARIRSWNQPTKQ